ncbi:hypothetical protein DFJ73DRAFT_774422 [Zopfochytrium polystomum]|nr:hypothetical protein DFJ73DRAFT_774422 [Zopfochytrium polystomum]
MASKHGSSVDLVKVVTLNWAKHQASPLKHFYQRPVDGDSGEEADRGGEVAAPGKPAKAIPVVVVVVGEPIWAFLQSLTRLVRLMDQSPKRWIRQRTSQVARLWMDSSCSLPQSGIKYQIISTEEAEASLKKLERGGRMPIKKEESLVETAEKIDGIKLKKEDLELMNWQLKKTQIRATSEFIK